MLEVKLNLDNKLYLKLCEFIFETAANMYYLAEWKTMNESMGMRLKKLYESKVINNQDLEILRKINDSLINEENHSQEQFIEDLNRLIDICRQNEHIHIIMKKQNAGAKFNFLDSLEADIIEVHEKMKEKLKKINLSLYTMGQVWDDFHLMIKIVENKKNLSGMDEEKFCEVFNLIYYNHEKHWEILKKWLLDKGCPKQIVGQFSLRFNAIYAIDMMRNNPEISIDEMLSERGIG